MSQRIISEKAYYAVFVVLLILTLTTYYAATLNDQQVGMAQMSEKFREMGNEVYVDAEAVKASNRAL